MLQVTVSSLDELYEKLDALEASLNPVDLLDEAEALMLNRIRTRFLGGVGPDNIPWEPSKRAIRTGGKTLFKTGKLFHSIQAHSEGIDTRAISTDVFYGRYHQFGIGRMRRPFMGVNDRDLYLVERLIFKRIEEALA